MKPNERKHYLENRVHGTYLVDTELVSSIQSSSSLPIADVSNTPTNDSQLPHTEQQLQSSQSSTCLSVNVNSFSRSVSVPFPTLSGIWTKAEDLLKDPGGNFSMSPGSHSQARMVKSYSSSTPHLVKPAKGGRFICDSNCAHYKSLGICSHTVAVAELNNSLIEFLAFYKKSKAKHIPNLTAMAISDMPNGNEERILNLPESI